MKKIILLWIIPLFLFAESYVSEYSTNGYNTASRISKIVDFIALQLNQNIDATEYMKSPMAITSFVNLEDFKDTNKFGNLIAENLVHDLYVRGFNIIDFKVMPYIEIDSKGDFIFSRKLDELSSNNVQIKYLVSGTWTYFSDGISLSVRIIDIKSHAVISSAKAFIQKEDVKDILNSSKALYKVEKKKDEVIAKVIEKQERNEMELTMPDEIKAREDVSKKADKKVKIEKEPDANLIL